MKNILSVIFFLLATQSYTQQINGIGIIQLGKSETEILTALKVDAGKITEGSSKNKTYIEKHRDKSIIKVKYDPSSVLTKSDQYNLLRIPKCDEATTYLLPKYDVAGTTFKEFSLTFYRDTLICIQYGPIKLSDLNDPFFTVFTAKYGEGVESTEQQPGYCDTPNTYTTNQWKTEVPGILVFKQLSAVCSEQQISYFLTFSIQNERLVNEMEVCSSSGQSHSKKGANSKLDEL